MVNIKRPILVAVVGYIIGIIMGLYFNFSIVLFYMPIIAMYFIYKKLNKKKKRRFKLVSFGRYFRYIKLFLNSKTIIVIILVSFVSNMQILIQNNKYETLYEEGDLFLKAIVVSNKEEKEYKNQYKIKVINQDKYRNTYLYLKIDKKQNLEYGAQIEVLGEFIKPEVARNYGGFNYKEYLKTLKIHGILNAKDIKIVGKEKANYIFMLANKLKLKIEEQIDSCLESNQAELLKGILLGDTSKIEETQKDNFRNANISHILAVSRFACFIYCNGAQLVIKAEYGKKNNK